MYLIVILLSLSYSATIPDLQIAALQDLFRAASLPFPVNDTCADPTLSCDDKGNVKSFIAPLKSSGVPPSVVNLLLLEELDLRGSWTVNLTNVFNASGLTLLKQLNLASCHLSVIPDFILDLLGLEELVLDDNDLAGIPQSIFRLPQLKTLSINSNKLSGQLPSEMQDLTSLSLSNNRLVGEIPDWSNHDQLLELYLDSNFLSGLIPEKFPPNLETLILSNNSKISGSLNCLAYLPNLQYFDASLLSLNSSIPTNLPNNLQIIILYASTLIGNIPPSIFQLTGLVYLSLAANELTGELPKNITNSLKSLYLYENNLTGTLPASLFSNSLKNLDLSNNQFNGTLPNLSSFKFGRRASVDLSNNNLTGSIPSKLFQFDFIRLSLAYNNLNGELLLDSLAGTTELYLNSNNLSGPLPGQLFSQTTLAVLRLDFNNFSGVFPGIDRLPRCRVFNFSFNSLSGPIPDWLFTPNIVDLNGKRNNLTGNISCVKATSLTYLDLSQNFLEGYPVECLYMRLIRSVDLTDNHLDWIYPAIPSTASSGSDLRFLALGLNYFKTVPNISSLTNLKYLVLSRNLLSALPNLTPSNLRLVDLSDNSIAGVLYSTFPTTLHSLILRNNSISAISPLFVWQVVAILDLTHNCISQPFPDLFNSLPASISILRLGNNLITGKFAIVPWLNSPSNISYSLHQDAYYHSEIDISNNYLDEIAFSAAMWRPYLTKVDLSNNLIKKGLDNNLCGYPLRSVSLDGNPLLDPLPSSIIPNYDVLDSFLDLHMECPTFVCNIKTENMSTIITLNKNWAGYYSYCRCLPGYFNKNGNCSACPDFATCPGHSVKPSVIVASPGYFPYLEEHYPTQMIPCRFASLTPTSPNNPCNPNTTLAINLPNNFYFYCALGSTDFLCSKCISGFFPKQGRCLLCRERFEYQIFLVITTLLVIFSVVYFFRCDPLSPQPQPMDVVLGVGTIVVDFFQTSTITISKLDYGPLTGDLLPFLGASFLTSVSISGVGLECGPESFANFHNQFMGVMVFPPLYIAILGLAFLLKPIYFCCRNREITCQTFFYQFIKSSLTFLNIFYFPLVAYTVNVFQCTQRPNTGSYYMSDRPYLDCDYLSSTTKITSLILYPIGLYLLFTLTSIYLSCNPTAREKERWFQSFGFFFKEYKTNSIFTGVIFISARLLLSFYVALIPSYYNYYPILISSVLMLKLLFVLYMQPFKRKRWNRSQAVGDFAALLIFWNSYTTNPTLFRTWGPDIYYIILHVLCLGYIGRVGVLEFFEYWEMRRNNNQNNNNHNDARNNQVPEADPLSNPQQRLFVQTNRISPTVVTLPSPSLTFQESKLSNHTPDHQTPESRTPGTDLGSYDRFSSEQELRNRDFRNNIILPHSVGECDEGVRFFSSSSAKKQNSPSVVDPDGGTIELIEMFLDSQNNDNKHNQ